MSVVARKFTRTVRPINGVMSKELWLYTPRVCLLTFEKTATVARNPPAESWMVTFKISNGVIAESCDVMLYQKVRVAELAPVGMVTVWYILPKRLLPDVPSGLER